MLMILPAVWAPDDAGRPARSGVEAYAAYALRPRTARPPTTQPERRAAPIAASCLLAGRAARIGVRSLIPRHWQSQNAELPFGHGIDGYSVWRYRHADQADLAR